MQTVPVSRLHGLSLRSDLIPGSLRLVACCTRGSCDGRARWVPSAATPHPFSALLHSARGPGGRRPCPVAALSLAGGEEEREAVHVPAPRPERWLWVPAPAGVPVSWGQPGSGGPGAAWSIPSRSGRFQWKTGEASNSGWRKKVLDSRRGFPRGVSLGSLAPHTKDRTKKDGQALQPVGT